MYTFYKWTLDILYYILHLYYIIYTLHIYISLLSLHFCFSLQKRAKRLHYILASVGVCCELIAVVWSTVAVNKLNEPRRSQVNIENTSF